MPNRSSVIGWEPINIASSPVCIENSARTIVAIPMFDRLAADAHRALEGRQTKGKLVLPP
jgi:hypothetical protein